MKSILSELLEAIDPTALTTDAKSGEIRRKSPSQKWTRPINKEFYRKLRAEITSSLRCFGYTTEEIENFITDVIDPYIDSETCIWRTRKLDDWLLGFIFGIRMEIDNARERSRRARERAALRKAEVEKLVRKKEKSVRKKEKSVSKTEKSVRKKEEKEADKVTREVTQEVQEPAIAIPEREKRPSTDPAEESGSSLSKAESDTAPLKEKRLFEKIKQKSRLNARRQMSGQHRYRHR